MYQYISKDISFSSICMIAMLPTVYYKCSASIILATKKTPKTAK